MSTVQTEQVMVIETKLFHECGYFQGFCGKPENYLGVLLDSNHTRYLPRPEMEQDPSFKQLIPYCIFQHVDSNGERNIFHYTRGKGSGESRLRAKKSVGIGGHISTLDAGDESAYESGMKRELDEEIEIGSRFDQNLVGIINDDSNEVGKVHLGIVHVFDLKEPIVSPRETEIADTGFSRVEELLRDLDSFETWSQICLKSLYGSQNG